MNSILSHEDNLDALLTLPKLYGGSVSRDGKWVAWMWMGVGNAMDIYAAPTDGSAPPIQLTRTSQNSYMISWLPTSDGIIAAQDNHGNERLQLFRIYLKTPQVIEPLTEEAPHYYIRGGQLHPNGNWLVYAANIDFQTGNEIEPTWIYRHNLLTGERKAIAQPMKGAYYFPLLNSTGSHIIYNRKDIHPAGYQLWLVDIEGQQDREIYSSGNDKKVYGTWLPDGKQVLIRAETETHFRVGLWDLQTEAIKWLIDNPNRYIENVHAPFGSQHLVISEVRDARLLSSLFDIETENETPILITQGNLQLIAPAANGNWVGKYYSSQHITDLVGFLPHDPQVITFKSLTGVDAKANLTSKDLTAAEDFRWESVDGLKIQGWLYKASYPIKGTIVYVHGGPTAHSEDALDDQIQFLVSQGFNVLDPNYRGSTGFNRAFTEAIKVEGWGGLEQEDIRTAIEAMIVRGIATKGKVGITGTSYGGYSSWHAITHFPLEIVSASAPICGMTDLIVDYETTRPDLRPYSAEMMGGTPQEVPQRYHDRSPIHFVKNIKGRLMIIQGLQDPNVTPDNVTTVKKELDKEGIEYEMLVFENEGHGIDRPENLRTLYTHLANFFLQAFNQYSS